MNKPLDAHSPASPEPDSFVDLLRHCVYPEADATTIHYIVAYCRAVGLDPLHRPVHVVNEWDADEHRLRARVLPGIGLYRTLAARSGCAGVDEPEYGPDITATLDGQPFTYPQWCRVTVHRRLPSGEIAHFTAREFWKENVARDPDALDPSAPNVMWKRRPYGQLAKCAEAQALRKGFPEVGALATAEELEGKLATPPVPLRTREEVGKVGLVPVAMPQARSNSDAAPSPSASPAGRSVVNDSPAIHAPVAPTRIDGPSPPPPGTKRRRRRTPGAPSTDPVKQVAAEVHAGYSAEPALSQPLTVEEDEGAASTSTSEQTGSQRELPTKSSAWDACLGDAGGIRAVQMELTAPEGEDGTASPPSSPHQDASSVEPVPAKDPASRTEPLASPGERAYVLRRVGVCGMSVEAAWLAAGLPAPVSIDALTRSAFQALLEACS